MRYMVKPPGMVSRVRYYVNQKEVSLREALNHCKQKAKEEKDANV